MLLSAGILVTDRQTYLLGKNKMQGNNKYAVTESTGQNQAQARCLAA